MANKKKRFPAAMSGWECEAKQEDINNAVVSHLRIEGPRKYREAYDAAKRLHEEGKQPDEIREQLRRLPHRQEHSAADSPELAKQKKIQNDVEDYLADAAAQGVEAALANRLANYTPPPGN